MEIKNIIGIVGLSLLALNAILGVVLLELAWSKTSRFRKPNLELE